MAAADKHQDSWARLVVAADKHQDSWARLVVAADASTILGRPLWPLQLLSTILGHALWPLQALPKTLSGKKHTGSTVHQTGMYSERKLHHMFAATSIAFEGGLAAGWC